MNFSAFQFLKPKPSPSPMVRIGGDVDGAYLVPDDLCNIGACFSPGVYQYKNFEDDLFASFGIPSHLCDYSADLNDLQTPLVEGAQTFQKLWLDLDGLPNSITLDKWVASLEPGRYDLMLQMDIEGAEYRTLFTTSAATIKRFRIMVIEIHALHPALFSSSLTSLFFKLAAILWVGLGKQMLSALNRRLQSGRTYHLIDNFSSFIEPYLIVPLLKKLSSSHVCVHAHANNYSNHSFVDSQTGMNMPSVIEVTLLRRDRLDQSNSVIVQPLIPHPLDITNSDSQPELTLNGFWTM